MEPANKPLEEKISFGNHHFQLQSWFWGVHASNSFQKKQTNNSFPANPHIYSMYHPESHTEIKQCIHINMMPYKISPILHIDMSLPNISQNSNKKPPISRIPTLHLAPPSSHPIVFRIFFLQVNRSIFRCWSMGDWDSSWLIFSKGRHWEQAKLHSWFGSKKSPTVGPTERTPTKTWVSNCSIATYLGVRW